MELRDFIVTPIVILLVYGIAYAIRPAVTDDVSRVYFIPALTVRILGALAVGFVYQFYYEGGDTFTYHTHGSRIVWEALIDDPLRGLKLLSTNNELTEPSIYKYASKIWFFNDPQSYFIIRIATIFDILTFSTYSATAILFAFFPFQVPGRCFQHSTKLRQTFTNGSLFPVYLFLRFSFGAPVFLKTPLRLQH